MKKISLSVLMMIMMMSCSGDFESGSCLSSIASQVEFSKPFYAPLHLGREVLTGVNHTNPDGYIRNKFGSLIEAELIKYEITEKNSWRTLVELSLTDKASSLLDAGRTARFQKEQGESDLYYVAVCRLVPQAVTRVDTISLDTMCIHYQIAERDITPFGTFLGFQDGRTHLHERNFIKSSFSWSLQDL